MTAKLLLSLVLVCSISGLAQNRKARQPNQPIKTNSSPIVQSNQVLPNN
jgi:hypothetical protein